MSDVVLEFIQHFTLGGKFTQVIDAFDRGCCYWFAAILADRFPISSIMYDPVENHFGTMIGGKIYDITGDVTDKYSMIAWDAFDEPGIKRRVISDCIMFE